jgi:hypothetical protein
MKKNWFLYGTLKSYITQVFLNAILWPITTCCGIGYIFIDLINYRRKKASVKKQILAIVSVLLVSASCALGYWMCLYPKVDRHLSNLESYVLGLLGYFAFVILTSSLRTHHDNISKYPSSYDYNYRSLVLLASIASNAMTCFLTFVIAYAITFNFILPK